MKKFYIGPNLAGGVTLTQFKVYQCWDGTNPNHYTLTDDNGLLRTVNKEYFAPELSAVEQEATLQDTRHREILERLQSIEQRLSAMEEKEEDAAREEQHFQDHLDFIDEYCSRGPK